MVPFPRSLLFLKLLLTIAAIPLVLVVLLRTGTVVIEAKDDVPPLFPKEAKEVEFVICTYNVQARPLFDETKIKFTRMSPLLNRFDICALQECFKDHGRLWAQAEHQNKIFHGTLKHPFKITGSGLSLLSKLPLVTTENLHFESCGEFQNWPASKGVLMARYQAGVMTLDVYTTHIEAGKTPAAKKAKEGQAKELAAFVKKHTPPENNLIILGDFNMRPSRGPEDKEAHKDNAKIYAFDWLKEELELRDASDEFRGPVGREIDRIMFRPGKDCAMEVLHWQQDDPDFYHADGTTPLSDHSPVFVKFKMEAL